MRKSEFLHLLSNAVDYFDKHYVPGEVDGIFEQAAEAAHRRGLDGTFVFGRAPTPEAIVGISFKPDDVLFVMMLTEQAWEHESSRPWRQAA